MSILRRVLGMGLGAALLGAAAPALASGCTPAPLARVPLTVEHNSMFLPMTLDGGAATFLLDTGAERTLVRTAAATRLHLARHDAAGHTVAGFGGNIAAGEVHPERVAIGPLGITGFFALVGEVTLATVRGQQADGLLGGDVLDGYDLDIDMAGRELTLYTPIDCADPALPWGEHPRGAAAHVSLRRHLVFDARIGGLTLAAFVDSGAQGSFIDSGAAAKLGITAAELAQDPRINAAGISHVAEGLPLHRFARLEAAGVVWSQPVLVVAPLHQDDADLVLGADFLDAHRAWFAYRAGRIFFAPHG